MLKYEVRISAEVSMTNINIGGFAPHNIGALAQKPAVINYTDDQLKKVSEGWEKFLNQPYKYTGKASQIYETYFRLNKCADSKINKIFLKSGDVLTIEKISIDKGAKITVIQTAKDGILTKSEYLQEYKDQSKQEFYITKNEAGVTAKIDYNGRFVKIIGGKEVVKNIDKSNKPAKEILKPKPQKTQRILAESLPPSESAEGFKGEKDAAVIGNKQLWLRREFNTLSFANYYPEYCDPKHPDYEKRPAIYKMGLAEGLTTRDRKGDDKDYIIITTEREIKNHKKTADYEEFAASYTVTEEIHKVKGRIFKTDSPVESVSVKKEFIIRKYNNGEILFKEVTA